MVEKLAVALQAALLVEHGPAPVAEAFLALALAESTTGSVATVDGGNLAAAPR